MNKVSYEKFLDFVLSLVSKQRKELIKCKYLGVRCKIIVCIHYNDVYYVGDKKVFLNILAPLVNFVPRFLTDTICQKIFDRLEWGISNFKIKHGNTICLTGQRFPLKLCILKRKFGNILKLIAKTSYELIHKHTDKYFITNSDKIFISFKNSSHKIVYNYGPLCYFSHLIIIYEIKFKVYSSCICFKFNT